MNIILSLAEVANPVIFRYAKVQNNLLHICISDAKNKAMRAGTSLSHYCQSVFLDRMNFQIFEERA